MTLMPQLCLAIRYERFIDSPLVELLLSRALESPRFAHCLYWQLVHNIPGNSPVFAFNTSILIRTYCIKLIYIFCII